MTGWDRRTVRGRLVHFRRTIIRVRISPSEDFKIQPGLNWVKFLPKSGLKDRAEDDRCLMQKLFHYYNPNFERFSGLQLSATRCSLHNAIYNSPAIVIAYARTKNPRISLVRSKLL